MKTMNFRFKDFADFMRAKVTCDMMGANVEVNFNTNVIKLSESEDADTDIYVIHYFYTHGGERL